MKKIISILTVFLLVASLLAGSASACRVPFPGTDILTVTQEGKPVAGAEFNLFRQNLYGGEDTLLGSYKTDANGTITASHLTTGSYYWEDGSEVIRKDFKIVGAGFFHTEIELAASITKTVTFNGCEVTIEADLSGGYLAEINDYGTLYLYDVISEKAQVCNGFLMNEDEYCERVEDGKVYGDGFKEENGVFISWTEGEYGSYTCLTKIAKDIYYMLVIDYDADMEAVMGRVTVSAEGAEEESVIGLANPWTDAANAEEAAEGAGVGYFLVPEGGTEVVGGRIDFGAFRFMDRLAEADGWVGAAELTVRKGLKQDSTDVSGDYTDYAYTWTVEADGWEVTCFGNEEGRMMKAVWLSDNFSYSIMVRGQGDYYTTYGLCEEDVIALVTAIQ